MRYLCILTVFVLAQVGATPAGPADANDPQYPLRVHILRVSWSGHHHDGFYDGATGFGRGDIWEPTKQGFDYTFSCFEPFLHTTGDEAYSARWKSQGKTLEILEEKIGTGGDRFNKCELKVDLKPYVYVIDNHNNVVPQEAP
jgi:hypothetical protein